MSVLRVFIAVEVEATGTAEADVRRFVAAEILHDFLERFLEARVPFEALEILASSVVVQKPGFSVEVERLGEIGVVETPSYPAAVSVAWVLWVHRFACLVVEARPVSPEVAGILIQEDVVELL